MATRSVQIRPVRPQDAVWLARTALRREFAGVQYSWLEAPLQLVAAPLRAALGPFVTACVILVDGRRAGYIGRSPLSGNYEYFVVSEARGGGTGKRAIAEFLAHHRAGDKARRFIVRRSNERSLRALIGALDEIGWTEGDDYSVHTKCRRIIVEVKPG
jgi:hypothetical protein